MALVLPSVKTLRWQQCEGTGARGGLREPRTAAAAPGAQRHAEPHAPAQKAQAVPARRSRARGGSVGSRRPSEGPWRCPRGAGHDSRQACAATSLWDETKPCGRKACQGRRARPSKVLRKETGSRAGGAGGKQARDERTDAARPGPARAGCAPPGQRPRRAKAEWGTPAARSAALPSRPAPEQGR